MKKSYYLILFVAAVFLFLHSGCGLIAVVGSEGAGTEVTEAEYPLAAHAQRRVLVLVEQPVWMAQAANMRRYVTKAVNEEINDKIEIEFTNLYGYYEVADAYAENPEFVKMQPDEIAMELGADLVLYIRLDTFDLVDQGSTGVYEGLLAGRASIHSSSGEKLWPTGDEAYRHVRVGFEMQQSDKELAIKRLSAAFAHCTVRYLYDCKKKHFRIIEDRSGHDWEQW